VMLLDPLRPRVSLRCLPQSRAATAPTAAAGAALDVRWFVRFFAQYLLL